MGETRLKITLDASDFNRALEEAGRTVREARAAVEGLSGQAVAIDGDASGAVEAADAAKAALDGVSGQDVAITGDASGAIEAADAAKAAIEGVTGKDVAITGDASGAIDAADAAKAALDGVSGQDVAITGDVSGAVEAADAAKAAIEGVTGKDVAITGDASGAIEAADAAKTAVDGVSGQDVAVTGDASGAIEAADAAKTAVDGVSGKDVAIDGDASGAIEAADAAKAAVEGVPQNRNVSVTADASQAVKGLEGTTQKLSALKRLASSLPGEFSALGQAIQAVVEGPMGAVVFAVQQLVEIGSMAWDALTESSEEMQRKAQGALSVLQREAEGLSKLRQEADGYLERLSRLSTAEASANTARQESIRLVRLLEEQYGNLGAQVDRTTGRLLNLAQVQRRVREEQAAREAGNAAMQAQKLATQARAAYVGDGNLVLLDREKGLRYSTEKQRSDLFDSIINNHGGDYGKAAQEMRRIAQASKNGSTIESFSKVAELLEQAAEKQREAAENMRSGFGSREDFRKAVAEAEGRRTDAAAGREADARAAERARLDRDLGRIDRDARLEELDAYEEKQSNRYQALRDVNMEVQELQERLGEASRQREAAKNDVEAASAEARMEEIQREIDAKEREREAIFEQLSDLEAEKALALRELEEAGAREAEVARLRARGDHEAAEALALQNELKEKGILLTEKETEALLARRRATRSRELRNSLAEQGRELLSRHGGGTEAALARAEATKGGRLDEAEQAAVSGMERLSRALGALKLDFSGLQAQTNSLTARGGFRGGASTSRLESINRRIQDYAARQASLLERIRVLVDKISSTEV